MKTQIPYAPLFILLMGLLMTSCAKKVVLQVNTDTLLKATDKSDLNQFASFKKQADTLTLEKFRTVVKQGRVIKWKGKALNGKDKVNIEAIVVQEGPNPFPYEIDTIFYKGRWRGRLNKVVKVKATGYTTTRETAKGDLSTSFAKEAEVCKYLLKFSVKRKGDSEEHFFSIDPEAEVQRER